VRAGLPVLVALHNPALRERHWARVQTILGNIFTRETLPYGDLLAMGVTAAAPCAPPPPVPVQQLLTAGAFG